MRAVPSEVLTGSAPYAGSDEGVAPAASAPGSAPASGSDPVPGVVLRLGGGRFLVPMVAVAEVIPRPVLTRVPGMPDWLAGVGNWRGRILPVLDVRGLLGIERAAFASSVRVVVLSRDGVSAGMLAEAVPGVLSIPESLDPPPVTLAGDAATLLRGQFVDASGPAAVLEPDAVLALRLRIDRSRRSLSIT